MNLQLKVRKKTFLLAISNLRISALVIEEE